MRKPQLFLHMKNDGHSSTAIVINQASEVVDKPMEQEQEPPPQHHHHQQQHQHHQQQRQEVEEQQLMNTHRQVYIEGANEHHVVMPDIQHHQPVHVYGISEDVTRRNDRERVPHVIIEGPISFAELEGSVSTEHMPHHMNYGVNQGSAGDNPMVAIPTSSHMIPVSAAPMYQRDMTQVMMTNRVPTSSAQSPMIIQVTVPKH